MTTPVSPPIVTGAPSAAWLVHDGPRRVLFLDRDGVINVNHGYVHTPETTDWVPGIFDLVRAARQDGFAVVVVTNQAGIARGYYTLAQFEKYTRWMHAHFAQEGVPLLATYYCPHHPTAGVGDYLTVCNCRKPAPGMLLRAASDFGIDLSESLLVGDEQTDLEAGVAAGVARSCLLPPKVGPGRINQLASELFHLHESYGTNTNAC